MQKRTKIIIGALLVSGLVAGGAYAAKGYGKMKQGRAMMQAAITEADTNSDKAISKEELMAVLKKRFDSADADTNQSVSKTELVAMLDGMKEMPFLSKRSGRISDRMFNQFDLNENGEVAWSELESRTAKFHAVADWNDDGKVEMSELRKLRMLRGGKRGGHKRGRWFKGDEAREN